MKQPPTPNPTIPYDLAEHLRNLEEMAAYLDACIQEAHGDAAFITKALEDIDRAIKIAARRTSLGEHDR